MLLLEEGLLEGENGEEQIHIPTDVLDTILFPGPDLGGDVVADGNLRMAADKVGYLQVETGVVNQDDHIGFPSQDIPLAATQSTEDSTQMEQYGNESHIGQGFVVHHALTTLRLH